MTEFVYLYFLDPLSIKSGWGYQGRAWRLQGNLELQELQDQGCTVTISQCGSEQFCFQSVLVPSYKQIQRVRLGQVASAWNIPQGTSKLLGRIFSFLIFNNRNVGFFPDKSPVASSARACQGDKRCMTSVILCSQFLVVFLFSRTE